ncbi:MAG: hypothetical protein AW08_03678 [Candidatus Accumulibacter adjunctus]|uniref:Uncharacterized protein n=1 Tax=Candidatus Accumulibacter adjunctus TaxID=1454001 RepID=A0A011PDZ2_9PROT|nr:MAG: hypothetical protein AW08_03678 [Candidatus Accumulibacter adjunctus]
MRFFSAIKILLVLGMVFVGQGFLGAQEAAGRKDCQFARPPQWGERTLSWDGHCQAGRAHGLGVLRAYRKGDETIVFYGRMEQGEMALGVIESRDGYQAGRFSDGTVMPEQPREVIINAFDQASAAARAFSQRLRKADNEVSAAYYLRKSQELARQMD